MDHLRYCFGIFGPGEVYDEDFVRIDISYLRLFRVFGLTGTAKRSQKEKS
jgi:hypothetical protein